jgi:hypothetical protein
MPPLLSAPFALLSSLPIPASEKQRVPGRSISVVLHKRLAAAIEPRPRLDEARHRGVENRLGVNLLHLASSQKTLMCSSDTERPPSSGAFRKAPSRSPLALR